MSRRVERSVKHIFFLLSALKMSPKANPTPNYFFMENSREDRNIELKSCVSESA